MRCRLLGLLSVLVWCSPGCMRCEHGLCSPGEPEAIFDSALLGEWTAIDPKHEERDVYLKDERDEPASKAYQVSALGSGKGKQTRDPDFFRVYLTKFGDSYFLDEIMPPAQGSRRVSHGIWKIEIKMPEMTIRPLSKEFVKDHPSEIHRNVEKTLIGIEVVTVTGTTQELGDFVRKYAHTDAAWTEGKIVLRHR